MAMAAPAEPGAARGPGGLARRMVRAALLRSDLYEEVEADRGATGQAFAVVVLAAVATGIGAIGNSGAMGIFWHTLVDVAGWYAWAFTTCQIGTRLLPTHETRADLGELLRTLGFASAPGVLRIGAVLEPAAFTLFTLCTLWMLVAMVVAVRQALDYRSTPRALAVCAIGLPVYAVPQMLSVLVLGPWPL
jgi:hypothetical protein